MDTPRRRPLVRLPSSGAIALHARVGAAYIVQSVKIRLAYRADLFAQLGASILGQIGTLVVVFVLWDKGKLLAGWDQNAAFFIYGFSMLPLSLFGMFSLSFYRFSDMYLIEGQFDRLLLRPLNALYQLMLEAFHLDSIWNFALGLTIMAVAWSRMDPRPAYAWWHVLLLGVMILSSAAVITGVFLALTAASFWMTDRVGILPPVYNFMQFGRYPLTIYRPWIQFLLTFIIPFGFAAFYPVTFFLPRAQTEFLIHFAVTPLVGIGVFALGYWIWSRGVGRYESTGT